MSKRERIPHTARFLQTFHTAGMSYSPAASADAEDRSAFHFVSGNAAPVEQQPFFHHRGYKVRVGNGLITEAQAKWVIDIAETKDGVTDAMVHSLYTRLEQGFARQAASQFITKYKDLPRRTPSAAAMEAIAPGASTEEFTRKANDVRDANGVKPGRYAIVEDGVTKFFRITEGKGRWAGRTFIEAQASDDHFPVRNPERRAEILKAIATNPLEAEQRYGRELGKCSRCGRTLTDETSRAYGIGPDCRNK